MPALTTLGNSLHPPGDPVSLAVVLCLMCLSGTVERQFLCFFALSLISSSASSRSQPLSWCEMRLLLGLFLARGSSQLDWCWQSSRPNRGVGRDGKEAVPSRAIVKNERSAGSQVRTARKVQVHRYAVGGTKGPEPTRSGQTAN